MCFFCSLAAVTIVILQLLPWLDVPGSHQTEARAFREGDHLCDHIGLFAAVVHQTSHPSIFLCCINTIAITKQRDAKDNDTREEQEAQINEWEAYNMNTVMVAAWSITWGFNMCVI